jgi:hypothetical protein
VSLDFQVTFRCHDADLLADFWATALDRVVEHPPPGFDSWPAFLEARSEQVSPEGSRSAIVDPDGFGPRLLFQPVADGATVRNRLHLDVRAGSDLDAKVLELTEAGGKVIGIDHDSVVMTDPEGNEFCVTAG